MNLGEALTIIDEYEADQDEIRDIIDSDSTPSEKIDLIAEIVGGDEEGEGEEDVEIVD